MYFKTVFSDGRYEFTEKKSRFIGFCYPVDSEEEVELYLEDLRKTYWNASHNNVYAYRLGLPDSGRTVTERFSDDGEPVHTAGLPLLNVLQGEDIRNTLLVTVRYFGGTLLGTGGLVRAYTEAGKQALQAAGVIEKGSYLRTSLPMDYTLLGKMQYGMLQEGYTIESTDYTDIVTMHLLIPEEEKDRFTARVTALSEGKLTPVVDERVIAAQHEGAWHIWKGTP